MTVSLQTDMSLEILQVSVVKEDPSQVKSTAWRSRLAVPQTLSTTQRSSCSVSSDAFAPNSPST